MRVDAEGWTVFSGLEDELAVCVAPAGNPKYPSHTCGCWFTDIGEGLRYRVRVHPLAGRIKEPKPTTATTSVHKCRKCGTHLEYEVVPALAATG